MSESSTDWVPWVRRPRELTEAEARLLAVLVASPSGTERSRIRRTGIPRSTYQRLRRRLYTDGWLRDRYLPTLPVLGADTITFVLGFPYAERASEIEQAWSALPQAPTVWSTPEFVFAVFVGPPPVSGEADRRLFPRALRSTISLTVRTRSGEVLRYFDYGPMCAKLFRFEEARAGSAPWSVFGPETRSGVGRPRDLRTARALVGREAVSRRLSRPPHLQGFTFLPRGGQDAIRRGLVRWQAVPDLRRIPPSGGMSPTDVLFVYAERRPGVEPRAALEQLAHATGVEPFLAAFDSDRALLAAIETRPLADGRLSHHRLQSDAFVHALGRSFVGIELFRERLDMCRAVVDHDYSRMVG